jgi:hypothetical protein
MPRAPRGTRPLREVPLKWLISYQRDEDVDLTKADCKLIQAHLLSRIDKEAENMRDEVEESLKFLLKENLCFLALFCFLRERHLVHFAERRRALYKRALDDQWAFNVLLQMRDMGNPLDLVDLNDL